MAITQKCQYALRAIYELARRGEGPCKIGAVAEAQGIPVRFLENILNSLKGAGFVDSARGKDGGYFLARPASAITVGEVIRFVQGDFRPVECGDEDDVCSVYGSCVFRPLWERAQEALEAVYDGNDLSGPARPVGGKTATAPSAAAVERLKYRKHDEVTEMEPREVYLDNSATTRVDPRVTEAMLPYFSQRYGNPNSLHRLGREAREAVDSARAKVAALINAEPTDIIFTGAGSEADNLAIKGAAWALRERGKGNHIITSAIEHHAILDTVKWLGKMGFEYSILPVDGRGMVSPEELEKAIRPDTILATIMAANNEIGTIQPVRRARRGLPRARRHVPHGRRAGRGDI